jgi:hypothetical protein
LLSLHATSLNSGEIDHHIRFIKTAFAGTPQFRLACAIALSLSAQIDSEDA